MMQQYKDIISTVDIQIQETDRQSANHYYKTASLLRSITGVFVIFAIVSLVFHLKMQDAAYVLMMISFLLFIWYRKTNSAKIRNILLKDCDPVRMLSFHTALISNSSRNKVWRLHFYNTCSALYYAGRFDDAKKVLALFSKYCSDNASRFSYELLWAKLSYYEKDEAALSAHCKRLEELAKMVHPTGAFRPLYTEAMTYPVLLQLENAKEYQKLYDIFQQGYTSYYDSMISKVKANYMMYQVAMAMGDEQTAKRHRDFVLKNGGSLWYRKAVERNG